MPARKYAQANTDYRYGFNGKENDNEVKGDGNQLDYGMRIYDPRIGKFLSLDPITQKYPELTPYQFASNTPVWAADLDGLEADFKSYKINRKEYEDYGHPFLNFFGNSEKISSNIGASAINQTLSTVEDATNLLFSSKGRKEVALKYGTSILNLAVLNQQFSSGQISPKQFGNAVKQYLSNPENLENLAGSFVASWATGKLFESFGELFKVFSNGKNLSKPQRLSIFYNRLAKANAVSSSDDAIKLINKTLDQVEDQFSGIKKVKGIPSSDDGRMYGILDEKFITPLEDGAKIAKTRGQRIVLNADGSFEIQTKDGGKTIF